MDSKTTSVDSREHLELRFLFIQTRGELTIPRKSALMIRDEIFTQIFASDTMRVGLLPPQR